MPDLMTHYRRSRLKVLNPLSYMPSCLACLAFSPTPSHYKNPIPTALRPRLVALTLHTSVTLFSIIAIMSTTIYYVPLFFIAFITPGEYIIAVAKLIKRNFLGVDV